MNTAISTIKIGNKILYKKKIWIITKQPRHVKPGKGIAYVQIELKNLINKNKISERFNSNSRVELIQLEKKNYKFLYLDKKSLIMMDIKTYEQISISLELLEDKLPLLQNNMIVSIEFYNENPVCVHLPQTISLKIKKTDPVIKRASSTLSYKRAILEGNIQVSIPSYLVEGEKIIIKTKNYSYVERHKI